MSCAATTAHIRVYPSLPHQRVALGLPPHPPLWLPRQFPARTEYRASPPVARRPASTAAARAHARGPSCRLEGVPAAVPVLRRTHVRHRSYRAPSFASIPPNGASPRHQDRHLMISFLRPPAPKVCRLFRRFSTGHDQAQTSTTTACRVAGSIAQILPEHSPFHPPSCSSVASQTAHLAPRGTPSPPPDALKSP
jgi:hypothetical protein